MRRFGVLPEGLNLNRPIWIHAVSVGEAIAMRGLIEELRLLYPLKNFVISTVTPTGNKIARTIAKDSDFVTYLPFDLSFITENVIKSINPCVFIIAETEIWPNLINTLYKMQIPVAILNARISDASFKGYALIKHLIRPVLNKVSLFCAQSKDDSARLNLLGASLDKIEVTGNMKFDQVPMLLQDPKSLRSKLSLLKGEALLVAGSTHPKEEEILLQAYRNLLRSHPFLNLLIAPRHPERAAQVSDLIKSFGFNSERVSLLNSGNLYKNTVFILDTVGELISFYAAADIVFVGGSLVKKGGHNILEPAYLNKPIIFGPHMFNFRDIAFEFLKHNAAIQIFSQEDLISGISDILGNNLKAKELVIHAREVISDNQGATKRNIALLRKLIV